MAHTVTPFLMFDGTAEAAMTFYVSLFGHSRIEHTEHYGSEGPGQPGSVKRADFVVAGQPVICIDTPVKHAFGFTPSWSFFVECETEAELDRSFQALSADGEVFMPLANYGFSRKFGWVGDRFGVSWQLNLA